MSLTVPVPAPVLELARTVAAIVREELGPATRVWLFGSWAQGTAVPRSDLDVAFENPNPTDVRAKLAAEERIDQLPTLRSIDLVDLRHAGEHIRAAVDSMGVEL
ncbi:MAG: nucleotidyltransferase domain-containing protein [Planctomycetes bacterium]|nr:nucleotidyltransferase domain-containing protein [Planctomycetota bacterium]